ncbi:MAG: hypothetical protein ACR2QJ_13500 [Geminicoccaceae bacterium]
MIDRQRSSAAVLVAALVLSLGLGSIHAFSVLLEPLEVQIEASRAEISLAYSIGLASLTVAVLVGYRLYRTVSASLLPLAACLLAASGLVVASLATHPLALWLGYGLIFGFANGVGYGFALYITNLTFERNRGLAMGSVTAVYAVGASGFAKVFDHWIVEVGADGALFRLSMTLVLFGAIASLCLWRSQFDAEISDRSSTMTDGATSVDRRQLALCWFTYGAGVAAGLMAMGHAAGIVTAVGGTVTDGVKGAIAITSANALGGFIAGYLADRCPPHRLLAGLGVASTLALLLLANVDDVMPAIASLSVVGFAYGSTIALFPIVTAVIFGPGLYAFAYGRIFTSWGLAGLAAPWFAGILYGHTDSYTIALSAAALLAALSAGMSLWLAGKPTKVG